MFYLSVPDPAIPISLGECFSFFALSLLFGPLTSIDCVPAVPKAQCGSLRRQINKAVGSLPPGNLTSIFGDNI